MVVTVFHILTENVDYNYKDYDPIGGMNLTIIIGEKDLKRSAYSLQGVLVIFLMSWR